MTPASSDGAARGWSLRRLTDGAADGLPGGTAHSYYDIPVFDGAGENVVVHRLPFTGRHPGPDDAIEVGVLGCGADTGGQFRKLGPSRAWSWQQGPLAQWIAGGPEVVWNDREGGCIVARVQDVGSARGRTLPGPVYAVDPRGRTVLSLDMTRLDSLRPGYGYPRTEERASGSMAPCPDEDGVWAMDVASGERTLVLSVARAVSFLDSRSGFADRWKRRLQGVHYWFNHAKISPNGERFTVKLRWRRLGGPWSDLQGVSLTCGMDGRDLRYLARGTSHVIWLDDAHLYFWHGDGLKVFADTAPAGTYVRDLAEGVVTANVHIRHLGSEGRRFVLDTPYREEVDLLVWEESDRAARVIARFDGHVPKSGPFRCDLHPCPSPNGERIVVTSPMSGVRDVYLLERE